MTESCHFKIFLHFSIIFVGLKMRYDFVNFFCIKCTWDRAAGENLTVLLVAQSSFKAQKMVEMTENCH